ncbi:MAG: polymer-forming cytoskeletal protein [Rickettsiales bacterium]|jgi:cytoskeletal protein CcmA (bactofilin family)|nr:polymer-forming cytoskeletal protein [Rickettsiales bacterium]
MFAFTNSTEKTSPTIIGAGAESVGEIKTDGIIQIHGIVHGQIRGDTIIIARGGHVIGRVTAKQFFLHGTMEGPATVGIANIFSDAKMTGTLSYVKLNISDNDGLGCKLVARKVSGIANIKK